MSLQIIVLTKHSNPTIYSHIFKYVFLAAIILFGQASFCQDVHLQNQLTGAHIENQKAQAQYYNSQAKTSSTKQIISNIIGSIIGALIALGGVLLNSLRQSRLEDKKWERTKEDEIVKETRLSVAELTKKLSISIHEIQWATWKARYDLSNIIEEELIECDNKMKSLWPEIVAASVIVAALNKEVYGKMEPLVSKVNEIDNQFAVAIAIYRRSSEEGILALATTGYECDKFNKYFINEVSGILNLEKINV